MLIDNAIDRRDGAFVLDGTRLPDVIPAKAGIHLKPSMDVRFRGHGIFG
jgi:hypothetical protein